MSEKIAIAFSLVGFVAVDEPIDKLIKELTSEELEELQKCLAQKLFKKEVRLALYPSIVPPDNVNEALTKLEKFLFSD